MLTSDEEKLLAKLRENITLEIEGKDTYDIKLYEIKWLTDIATELNEKLKRKPEVKEVAVVHTHIGGFKYSEIKVPLSQGLYNLKVCDTCHLVYDVERINDEEPKYEH